MYALYSVIINIGSYQKTIPTSMNSKNPKKKKIQNGLHLVFSNYTNCEHFGEPSKEIDNYFPLPQNKQGDKLDVT